MKGAVFMPTGNNETRHPDTAGGGIAQRLVKTIVALSRLCGVIAAPFILIAVLITCQMIWIRFVFKRINGLANGSGHLSYGLGHLGWPTLCAIFARPCSG